MTRHEWDAPSDGTLQKHHPLTHEPFWKFILARVGAPVSDSGGFPENKRLVHHRWRDFLERLSWWELKRYFNRQGETVVVKPKADVVVVHPVGRFPQARTDKQWQDACFWTLLAHCNHGEMCPSTFRDADHLQTFSFEAIIALTQRFATASAEERVALRLAPCPPHVAKAWRLGVARREAAEERRHSASKVAKSLPSAKCIFTEEAAGWQHLLWESVTQHDRCVAAHEWQNAE